MSEAGPDDVLETLVELGGAGLAVVDFARGEGPPVAGAGVVRVGMHRQGPRPQGMLKDFDILLSADPEVTAPWVGLPPERLDETVETLADAVRRQPVAAAAAVQVLRVTLRIDFEAALALESAAYSMLLASGGFREWRAAHPRRERADEGGVRVSLGRSADGLSIRLERPQARNAFDARMRDELCEALAFALSDPDASPVVLSGAGPAFSAGGDLDEFGRAGDVGRAHLIRTTRSPARLAHALGGRLTARLHGACVGAGIEVPAAAARVTARPGTYFRLPEVSMGLIPGAGGTATIPRRIGRQRATYMTLSGATIDLSTAVAWGLVDAVEA